MLSWPTSAPMMLGSAGMVEVPLAQHLCEASWSACAPVNRVVHARLHSRLVSRTLAAGLPVDPGSAARRCLWRRLCLGGILRESAESYGELAARPSQADAEIRRDLGRTFPQELGEEGMESLFRILRAVSHRLEDIGYCQGMNFIAGVLLRVFGLACEVIAYQCMLSILLRHGMNQYFGDRFPKLRLSVLQFDILVDNNLPDLGTAFDTFNLSAEFYATQWFLTLFSYSLPFPHVLRLWDQFLCRGMKFMHRVGLALLQRARPEMLGLSFDGTVQYLRTLGRSLPMSPEELVAAALAFKVTNRTLWELESALLAAGPTQRSGGGSAAADAQGGRTQVFPERNLDNGHTRWLLLPSTGPAPAAGSRSASASSRLSSKSTPAGGGGGAGACSESAVDFLEDALPAPRIPIDPSAPVGSENLFAGPVAAGVVGERAKGPLSQRLNIKRSFLHTVRRRRRPSDRCRGSLASEGGSFSRTSSVPAIAGARPPLPCEARPPTSPAPAPLPPPSSQLTSSVPLVRVISDPSSASSSVAAAPSVEGVPKHLRPFAIRDLDTGAWTLLDDGGGGRASSPVPCRPSHRRPKLWPRALRRQKGDAAYATIRGPPEEHTTTDLACARV